MTPFEILKELRKKLYCLQALEMKYWEMRDDQRELGPKRAASDLMEILNMFPKISDIEETIARETLIMSTKEVNLTPKEEDIARLKEHLNNLENNRISDYGIVATDSDFGGKNILPLGDPEGYPHLYFEEK